MAKHISITQARVTLSALVADTQQTGVPYIISRHGTPAAAIVPLEILQSWHAARERLFSTIEEVRSQNQHVDPDELEALIAQAIRNVRRQNPR